MGIEDAILDKIKHAEYEDVLGLVVEAWDKNYGAVDTELRAEEALVVDYDDKHSYVRFATGGWSWNEAVIAAFCGNTLGWMFTWELSARGGLHIFREIKE